jgi:hypothetical protein
VSAQALPWQEAAQNQGAPPAPWEEAKASGVEKKEEPGPGLLDRVDTAITSFLAPNPANLQRPHSLRQIASQGLTDPEVAKTLGREVYSGAKSVVGIPGGLYHAFTDPESEQEKTEYGALPENPDIYDKVGLGVGRMTAIPLQRAIRDYSSGLVTPDVALENAPEAIGQGAGTVVAGRLAEEAPGVARAAAEKVSPGVRAVASAPVRLAARGAETAINQKLIPARPVFNLMTPADEAEATQFKVPGRDYGLKTKPASPAPELDATAENKPFAGGPDEYLPPRQRTLDATGENKPFAGGMDEVLSPAGRTTVAAPASTSEPVWKLPETGPMGLPRETLSTVAAAPREAPIANAEPSAVVSPRPATQITPAASPDPILAKLRANAAKIQSEEAAAPETRPGNEDLTDILQKSVAQVEARKGIVRATAPPQDLLDRWGVDEKSFTEGRSQTRGMKPDESAAAIKKLTARYKSGQPVDPVEETRDADNNLVDVDGRGRALAAHKAGIARIPVTVRRIGTQPVPTLEPE